MAINKEKLRAKLNDITEEDFKQWASTRISRLFFNEFLDEILEVIASRKNELPVESMSDQEVVNQMRALSAVSMFLDDLKGAQNYETFINTFDLGEEDDEEN